VRIFITIVIVIVFVFVFVFVLCCENCVFKVEGGLCSRIIWHFTVVLCMSVDVRYEIEVILVDDCEYLHKIF
jgi:hypothetical protein